MMNIYVNTSMSRSTKNVGIAYLLSLALVITTCVTARLFHEAGSDMLTYGPAEQIASR